MGLQLDSPSVSKERKSVPTTTRLRFRSLWYAPHTISLFCSPTIRLRKSAVRDGFIICSKTFHDTPSSKNPCPSCAIHYVPPRRKSVMSGNNGRQVGGAAGRKGGHWSYGDPERRRDFMKSFHRINQLTVFSTKEKVKGHRTRIVSIWSSVIHEHKRWSFVRIGQPTFRASLTAITAKGICAHTRNGDHGPRELLGYPKWRSRSSGESKILYPNRTVSSDLRLVILSEYFRPPI